MDVATALAVAQTLFATLQCTEVRKLCSILKYESELQKLQATIETIKKDLLDADSKCQELTNAGQHWVENLKVAVYDADDLFDEFNTIAHQFEKMPGRKISKKVRRFFSSKNQLIFAYSKSREIKKIREMLDDLTKNHEFRKLYKPEVMSREETCSYVYEQDIIGRDADKKAIEDLLLKDELEDNVSFVTVVGMGGLGKTALAQLVFNDPRIENSFDKKYWVCVSEKRICMKDILGKMTGKNELNLEMLQRIVQDEIKGNKYFLVLDDAWSENECEWHKLTDFLKLGGRGSRILVTSRSEKVATAIGELYPIYKLLGLSDEVSWELFRKISLVHRTDQHDSGLVEIGKAIVRKCANVPLSIRVIAGLLRGQKIDVWESYKSIDLAKMSGGQNQLMATLMFSYYHLTPELKTCFSFCSIFPEDYAIPKKKLISMWLAQGYLVRSCDSESEEDVGEKYFSTLLHRCFFQDVKGENSSQKRVLGVTFKMHDLMHDLAQKVAKNESLVLTENKIENFEGKFIRHLSGDVMESSLKRVLNDYRSKKSRSFYNLDMNEVEDEDELVHRNINVNEIIHKCRRLRVLDLGSSLITWTLPESVGKLLHLRYLDLSCNDFEMLPESVAKLHNLHTLDLYFCEYLKELPKEMSRLVNLRILDIGECISLSHMPAGMDKLTCLHTLPMFVMSGDDDKNGKLLQALVKNLRGEEFTVNYGNLLGDEFVFSRQVQPGRVFPKNHDFVRMDIYRYEGAIFPSWASEMVSTCFKGLVRIYFSDCRQLEQLPSSLSQLCHLQHLQLHSMKNMEYIESKTPSPSAAFFPSLKSLYLMHLPKLKGWWRDVRWMKNGVGGGSFVDGSNKPVTLPSFPKLCNLRLHLVVWCDGRMTNFPPWSSTLEKFETDSSCVFNTLFGEFVLGSTLSVLFRHMNIEWGTTREGFGNCASSLLHLQINDCSGLENLPVEHLTNLKSLILSDFCCSQNLDGIAWEYLHSLTSLKISYFNRLIIPPNTIQKLTSLQTLNLQCCYQLESLGEGLNSLTTLQVIQIKYCPKLKSLPQEIRHLTSLTTLKIENCPELTILPEVMCHLSSLPKLEITDCPRLTSPPEAM